MNPDEILRIVDQIHLDRYIDKEIVFVGIEQALAVAARKHGNETAKIVVHIDRQTGEISAFRDDIPVSPEEISGRIGAQTAKQVIIQKMREAEQDMTYNSYVKQLDQLVGGIVHRNDGATTTVELDGVEAILPRTEKIPGDSFHPGERVGAVIVEVKKSGTKVKVILSRTRPLFLQRLFEQEVPEIAEGVIEIKGIAREAGHRSKVAVACSDPRIDSVGACIGMRRSRIRNITDELGGERIDVVGWDSNLLVFIPRSLAPAVIDEVILSSMLGRAIVLVQRDQRSLAIGKRGQNVRLASKLCGWDIEIMTRDELDDLLAKAMDDFLKVDGVTSELADRLVGAGFFSFDDFSIIEPLDLKAMGNLTDDQVDAMLAQVDEFVKQEEESQQNQSELDNDTDLTDRQITETSAEASVGRPSSVECTPVAEVQPEQKNANSATNELVKQDVSDQDPSTASTDDK
ncbi:MAG: transcription termination factor NusA, partial [Thermoguttaceae bacterium]|nr:transcription termination factor NusA [Thermoguttaceae bacterium]